MWWFNREICSYDGYSILFSNFASYEGCAAHCHAQHFGKALLYLYHAMFRVVVLVFCIYVELSHSSSHLALSKYSEMFAFVGFYIYIFVALNTIKHFLSVQCQAYSYVELRSIIAIENFEINCCYFNVLCKTNLTIPVRISVHFSFSLWIRLAYLQNCVCT